MNLKSWLKNGLLLVVALLMEESFFPFIFPESIHFRLVAIWVLANSFAHGSVVGTILGGLAGALMDLCSGCPLGLSILSLGVVGYLGGEAVSRFFIVNKLGQILAVAIILVGENLIVIMAGWLVLRQSYGLMIWPALVSGLVAPFLIPLVAPVVRHPAMSE